MKHIIVEMALKHHLYDHVRIKFSLQKKGIVLGNWDSVFFIILAAALLVVR